MRRSRLRRPVALTGFGVVALGLLALVSQAHGGVALAQAPVVSNVEFAQVDWFGSQAPVISDSEWGELSADITPGSSVQYVNVVANTGGSDEWIVRNLPTPPISLQPSTVTVATNFDLGLLGVSRGTDITSLDYFLTLDPVPLTAPPSGSLATAPVGDVTEDAEGRPGGPLTDPGSPPDLSVLNFSVGPFGFAWHSGVPNIDLDDAGDVNGCGPAAAANSLKWLGASDALQKIYDDMNAAMGRPAGQTISDNAFLSGKLDYIKNKKLGLEVKFQDDALGGANFPAPNGPAIGKGTTPDFDFIEKELDAGEDIELGMTFNNGGGHWVTLTGKIDLGLAQGVWSKDDGDQDSAGGTRLKFGWLKKRDDGFLELSSFARNKVDIVVSESPKPVGGITELLVGGPDPAALPANGSSSSAPPYAPIAGGAAAALAIAATGWYARRRLS